ncbi:MAG: hypothetical protein M1822_006627 [Bathelium mastoideum]|nr:MAG: hypothetical protein M1822_006627 [Bathelium mastoideum]
MRTKDANSSANDHKDDAADEGIGSRAEIRIWQKRYKRDGAQETVAVESLGGSQRFDTHFAVVVEQVFTERNALDLTRLTINSPHILRALREVVGSYPTVPADFNEPFEMESPFQMLFHYWEDLDVYRQRAEDDDARMHLNILLDFMETDMGLEKKRCDTQVKKEQVDYLRLWTIYRPGDLQIAYEKGHAWLLRCVKTAYEESQSAGKWMEVHCTYTDYDGTHVGEAQHIFKIYQKKAFASENPANIKDLPVYPRRFVVEQEGLEERLTERGKRSLTLRGIHVCAYEGLAAYIKEPPLDWWHWNMLEFETIWWPYTESGRVVIDRKTFQEDNQLAQVAIRPDTVDPELMLYPPFVYGYSLSRKEWCRFYVPQISDVEWNSNSFDKLILQESQKTLLRALVSSHAFPPNPRDQTQQKGKGLVVLLHGSPGSGKTLTAECSAELTHKALLSTSMAELNKENRAWYFEYRLAQVLQYATIWQAVVLLDEADVFLEARKDDSSDASERNALVAVFLKHLEYFSGIVFLTTNRIHVFDAAMKSRVHLALGYKPPEREMRRAIWRQTLLSLPAENIKMDVDDAIESLIDENLNGREITNAIHTARTLARYEESPLMLKHIETVFGVKNDFEVSLKRMRDFALASGSSRGGSLVKPLVRQGSLLGALSDEPEELGQ